AFSYFVLLAFQMLAFLSFPVEVPPDWREEIQASGDSRSQRFLALVQRFDARSNCFPSMHVSVATLTALHTFRNMPSWGLAPPILFVVLIAVSCIFTKQHYLIDLPFGVVFGWASFLLFVHFF